MTRNYGVRGRSLAAIRQVHRGENLVPDAQVADSAEVREVWRLSDGNLLGTGSHVSTH